MEPPPLAQQIIDAFDGLSAQLRLAARYVLDRPRDVALLSMREQARQAGVQPATMTRLAKHIGLSGYDAVRETYAAALRGADLGFAGRAGAQVASQQRHGDAALAAAMLASIRAQLDGLADPAELERVVAAAGRLAAARRIYCLGLRSSHAVAWHVHYILSLVGGRTVHLDGAGGAGLDAVAAAGADDVLLAASVMPYTRAAVEVAAEAARRGVPVVAITDSAVAPLATLAEQVVLIPTGSPSFFHTMAPAFVVAEILAVLVAGRGGEAALAALRETDRRLATLNTHLQARPLGRTARRQAKP